MNWLQERLMMSSTVAAPGAGAGGVTGAGPVSSSGPSPLHSMFPSSSSPSPSASSPAGPMSYEGRMAMIPPPAYPNPYQSQFTANLNFNLINNSYKQKEAEAASESFEGNLSPSSGTGSPRTDETLDKPSSEPAEADTSHEMAETLTGLEMLRQQANNIPKPPGLSIRQDIQTPVSKSSNKNNEAEIHDVEENEEELLIDEEMEENDNSREKHEETFEEVPVDKVEKLKQFSNFQPYLNVKEGGESGAINSLEKLQQALNNRIFDNTESKAKTTSIVTNGNAVNGNCLKTEESEAGSGEYKFTLPPDEEGIVYQCHLCSYTATTRVNFNAHVNTHYDFQCVKCDFECKSESNYCRHLKEEHNCTPEDMEEAEVRVPRVNSQGKVKTFKCKQCEFVAVTKLEFWKHGRGHIKPEKLLFCPKCIFVTEYKHHLEYHLRNHYGTKPFRCTSCNYSCVNKSMLNSHMKSHTNVYQYRCADCTYATKYCHSLKLHLKKYAHKPAMVLNNDGSPNPLPVIDVFGNKRGPKNSKNGSENCGPLPGSGLFPSLPPNFPSNLPNFPPNFPFLGLSQLHQQLQQSQFGQSGPKIAQVPPFRLEPEPDQDREERGVSPPMMDEPEKLLRCEKCEFSTSSVEVHKNHMLLHASSERGALHRLLTSPLQSGKTSSPETELGFSPMRKRAASPGSPQTPLHNRGLFQERSESPVSSSTSPMDYFNKIAIANPLLQGLVPNPAIKALMEQRKRENSLGSSPDSLRNDSPSSREDAPLPPNKRLKTDIFASLYANANKMSELAEKGESPNGVLDLSKECGDNIIGGGSHGSSSDNETGSNPRSHSSSPSLTSSTSKSRRKGKAYKIERPRFDMDTNSEEEPAEMPGLMPIARAEQFSDLNSCKFCGISFKNSTMHAIHMNYHANGPDPFKCNLCGDKCSDALSFFLHIARKEHS